MKIIDTTDKKYLNIHLNDLDVFECKPIEFFDGFIFIPDKIFEEYGKIILSNNNYIIICEGD